MPCSSGWAERHGLLMRAQAPPASQHTCSCNASLLYAACYAKIMARQVTVQIV